MLSTETQTPTETPRTKLPLISKDAEAEISALEAELREFEAKERERLGLLEEERQQWKDDMTAPVMRRKERDHVTLLISGLTAAQDFLVEGALRGQGYKVLYFGMPDNESFQVGKEYGNRGQCNPTHFTVGNLVKHLIHLRDDKGMSTEDVIKNYAFLTAGACGPCRFGMYVTEYRKALRDAGFDGFRVMLFQQTGGLSQATGSDLGLELNPPFFLAILKALVSGDAINGLGYRIRPYEVNPGDTDRALEESKRLLYAALESKTNIFLALNKARKRMEQVKVDRLRAKAKVNILGEFWAMTTEGDGNYALQRFVEGEGGENTIQHVTGVLLYNIWEFARDTRERLRVKGTDGGQYGLESLDEFGVAKRLLGMAAADKALRGVFQAFAKTLGLYRYPLPDMNLVAEIAHEHYSNDLRGGEGHMEVGKVILNALKKKANLTISVKPFGCMPSSGVSDGVQSLVSARYPGALFCAVETSGDAAANFYSRVQMFMYKARIAAEEELKQSYIDTGVTEAEMRAFLEKNPRFASPLFYPKHKVACTAANLVYELAPMITETRLERARKAAVVLGQSLSETAQALPAKASHLFNEVKSPAFREHLAEDARLIAGLVTKRLGKKPEVVATQL